MQRDLDQPIAGDANLDELFARVPEAASVFVERRMHCVGCWLARFETVADACRIYGQPLDTLLESLNTVAAASR